MSRSTKSASRSRSRSRYRSRSRSTSRSTSHSRSRKHRYSSRSRSRTRSRSRSRSPSHYRDKKYPRGYQNNRESRGYHRGFRRPYNFRGRGRGRGYFQRGRYQRGGGGYNNSNNNNNNRHNWKNYKQKNQQKQSRGQLHNVQDRSGTPPLNRSDRSSTPLSRNSQHSLSPSHSTSPKGRPALCVNQTSKDVPEEHSPKHAQTRVERDGKLVELVGVLPADKDGSQSGKTQGNWIPLTEVSSPKKASPLTSSVCSAAPSSLTATQSSPTTKYIMSNGALSWHNGCNAPSTKKSSQDSLNPMLSSFDFFSTEEYLDGDKKAISIAFRKFLEEQSKKGKAALQNGTKTESSEIDMEQGKVNGKEPTVQADSGPGKYKEDGGCEMSLNSFLKASPFLSVDGEEDEEMMKAHSKESHIDWLNGDERSEPKNKVAHIAQQLFEERFGKWQNTASVASGLDTTVEDLCVSRKQEKAAVFSASLAKREFAQKFEDTSPERGCKARKMVKTSPIPSPSAPPRRNSDMFMSTGEDSYVMPRKQDAKFNVRMDFLGESLVSTSDILVKERQLSQDLMQSSKKDKEFRSIFQHVQTAQLQRSPSELFAQHIVTIVHHIKAQHFPSSGLTLNERFTMYQRQAAEKEMMKPRKSPEIHRRIDVSPSAFRKHSQIFEAIKTAEEGTYKEGGEKMKKDPRDLRMDIERRKNYTSHDYNHDQDVSNMGDSLDSGREERSTEMFSKCLKKSIKSIKKRSRTSSLSSSSSSSKSHMEDVSPEKSGLKEEGLKTQLDVKETQRPCDRGRAHGGFIQICGQSWNRGSYQGNSSQCNPTKNENWDPEYTPKSKKYYLHDVRETHVECKWIDNRGRGRGNFSRGRARFIIRKANSGPNSNSSKWAQVNGEQRGDTEQNHHDEREHT